MKELLEAITSCDQKKLENLLPNSRAVNGTIPGTEGCTPLHIIVGIESLIDKKPIITYLLEKGGDPNARTFDGLTPVHIAAMWNKCSELEQLLQNNGNPWLTDNENKNSFSMAVDNHAYEANQLLHKYLSEDKLNFRNHNYKFKSKPYLFDDTIISEACEKTYCTANENFPLTFSSSEDGSIPSFNVSEKFQGNSRRNETHSNGKEHALDEFTIKYPDKDSSYRSNEDLTDHYLSTSADELNLNACASETESGTKRDILYNLLNVVSKELSSRLHLQEDESSSSDDEVFKTIVLDSDEDDCVLLVEKSSSPLHSSSSSFTLSKFGHHETSDWKDYQSWSESHSLSQCSTHTNSLISIPKEYEKFSNSKIYEELCKFGDEPGPIMDSTRAIYLRRLLRLKMGCAASCVLPIPKFPAEVYKFIEGTLDLERGRNLMDAITEEFLSFPANALWREGSSRCSFNYFLLDPRVTQNLPARARDLTSDDFFLTFLDAVFYIGKGTKERPYSHLIEAAKFRNTAQHKSDKVAHILDIWNSGMGVVSLHSFHNCVPMEAYTQEACMIEAIGLKNLTNIKTGDYYGKTAKWKKSWKRQVGVVLLHRAFQIFLFEGEKQVLPKDIRWQNKCL